MVLRPDQLISTRGSTYRQPPAPTAARRQFATSPSRAYGAQIRGDALTDGTVVPSIGRRYERTSTLTVHLHTVATLRLNVPVS
jgi:hypothetical protein